MSDVLEGGRPGRPRRPLPLALRAVFIAVVGVVVGGLVLLFVRPGSPGNSAKPDPTPSVPPSQSALPTASAQLSPSQPADGGVVGEKSAPWPSASGACGSFAFLPIGEFATQLPTQFTATNGRFLVGGSQLWQVGVSAAAGVAPPAPIKGLPKTKTTMVTALVSSPDGEFALISSCDNFAAHVVYRITGTSSTRLDITGIDGLVGGVHHTWAVGDATPVAPSTAPTTRPSQRITPLGGGRALVLQPNAYLFADVAAGLIVVVSDPVDDESVPLIELVDPATAGAVKPLLAAFPVAAQGNTLLVEPAACGIDSACTLLRVDLATGRLAGSFLLPKGRLPTSGVVFSADGRRAAFQLSQAHPDQRFTTGDPFAPSDVAVLDLVTGNLSYVSNFELAPKTSAGLAFDDTARSLFIAVNQGSRSDVLVWQEGMPTPAFVTSLPGALAGPVSMLARS